jgi:hypothetical protein
MRAFLHAIRGSFLPFAIWLMAKKAATPIVNAELGLIKKYILG